MYFTVAEAAKLLNISKGTIYRWTTKGKLKFKYFGKVLYISSKELTMQKKAITWRNLALTIDWYDEP